MKAFSLVVKRVRITVSREVLRYRKRREAEASGRIPGWQVDEPTEMARHPTEPGSYKTRDSLVVERQIYPLIRQLFNISCQDTTSLPAISSTQHQPGHLLWKSTHKVDFPYKKPLSSYPPPSTSTMQLQITVISAILAFTASFAAAALALGVDGSPVVAAREPAPGNMREPDPYFKREPAADKREPHPYFKRDPAPGHKVQARHGGLGGRRGRGR